MLQVPVLLLLARMKARQEQAKWRKRRQGGQRPEAREGGVALDH